MALAGVGEVRLGRRLVHRRRRRGKKPRGEHVGDGRSLEVAGAEGLIAADHGQRSAVADVLADAVEVLLQVVPGPVAEILEDDEVEGLELLLEDLLRREGNERQLVLRGAGVVARRAEDEEADQVHVGIALEELAQEAHVPARPAHHQHHPDAVANYFEHKRFGVVLRQRLAFVDGSRDLEGELAGAVGNEGQLRLGPLDPAADPDGLLRHDLPFPAHDERDVGRAEAPGRDGDVDGHLGAHEGEVVDRHLLDGEVLHGLRSDRQREDGSA
jgi:hypothetical protein